MVWLVMFVLLLLGVKLMMCDVVRLRGSDGVVRDVRVVAVGGEVDDV